MSMRLQMFSLFSAISLCSYYLIDDDSKKNPSDNSPPEVTIIKPADQSEFHWSSIVPYTIRVSDKEDGNSEFDEIIDHEVILEVTYLSNGELASKSLTERSDSGRNILHRMSKSNCLNCHAARTKLIGPSFALVAERYANQGHLVENLANKLITGSVGFWGEEPMPPHPALEVEKAKEMVSWILDFGRMPNYSFYTGTEGAFKTKEKSDEDEKSVYILTASYIDHGQEDVPNSSAKGEHLIKLINRN